MTDLTEFLLARIAETIADARHAQAQAVTDRDDPTDPRRVELRLARFVLAECEAKRRIVEEARRYQDLRKIRPEYRGDLFAPEPGDESLIRQYRRHPLADDDDDWPWVPGRIWKRQDYDAQVLEPRREFIFLRLLALPYADHPSFREEWRP